MPSKLNTTALALSIAFIFAALLAATWLAFTYGPTMTLEKSGVDLGTLTASERLSALNDARVTMLTAIGGVSAAFVITGALWQANSARLSFNHQRTIDWSSSFSRASEQLGNPIPPVRLAGVVSLIAIASSGPKNAPSLVRSVLASFVRNTPVADPTDHSVQLALITICNSQDKSPQSLAEARLNDFDLSGLDFSGLDLTGASMRNAILSESQRALVGRAERLDAAGARWRLA